MEPNMEPNELKALEASSREMSDGLTARAIRSMADLDAAKTSLAEASAFLKKIKAKKETVTKPLNEALRAARAVFAPIESRVEEAITSLKGRMLDYDRKLRAEEERKSKEAEAKIASGETTLAKAGASLERVEAKRDAIPTQVRSDCVVTDESLVPDAYWVIDMVKLRRDVLAGVSVPGAAKVEKTIIVNR
jgi:hypothetical protein